MNADDISAGALIASLMSGLSSLDMLRRKNGAGLELGQLIGCHKGFAPVILLRAVPTPNPFEVCSLVQCTC